jgi:hypothetical protein
MGDGNLQDCRLHPLYPISHYYIVWAFAGGDFLQQAQLLQARAAVPSKGVLEPPRYTLIALIECYSSGVSPV